MLIAISFRFVRTVTTKLTRKKVDSGMEDSGEDFGYWIAKKRKDNLCAEYAWEVAGV